VRPLFKLFPVQIFSDDIYACSLTLSMRHIRYLECGSGQSVTSQAAQVSHCLEKLLCLIHDPGVNISKLEKSVANM
jgi:hypothetical protein